MGTNFYLKRIPSIEDKEKMKKLIDEDRFVSNWENEDVIDDSLKNMLYNFTEEIHIGKRSGGWQFSFDHNWGKYYQPNRKSINEFLHTPNTKLVDEYGEEITPEDFWNMVDEWNASPDNNWVSKTYREWERKVHPEWEQYDECRSDKNKCKELWGVDIDSDSTDFEVDGLRFPVFSNFS